MGMLDFIIVGLPRSGTTWAANFFTTDTTLCLHDPLYRHHYADLDRLPTNGKRLGISCTGIWRFPTWLNAHPAKKIILRRPLVEVNGSMADIGLPGLTEADLLQVAGLKGEHFLYSDMFNPYYARQMCEALEIPFDEDRHAELVQIEMQPKFSGLTINRDVTRRLVAEIRAALT